MRSEKKDPQSWHIQNYTGTPNDQQFIRPVVNDSLQAKHSRLDPRFS
jgi:hypothetical protein